MKSKNINKKTHISCFMKISFFLAFIIILYSFGRIIRCLPPIEAIVCKVQIYNLKNTNRNKSIEYSKELDRLADIYYEKHYEKLAVKSRLRSLESFIINNQIKSPEYADCLYKYSVYLYENNKNEFKRVSTESFILYSELFKNNNLKEDSKSYFVKLLLSISHYEDNQAIKLKYFQTGLEVINTIFEKTTEDLRNEVLLIMYLGDIYSDDYTTWIDAQDYFEEAIKIIEKNKFKFEAFLVKLLKVRLLNKMHNYDASINLLNQIIIKKIKNKDLKITYHKLKYDAYSGLGDMNNAEIENEKINILNYENDEIIKFITYANLASKHIRKNNKIKSYYYLFRLNLNVKKHFLNDKQRLYVYYYLKYLFYVKFEKINDAKLCNLKVREFCDKNSDRYLDLLLTEAYVAKKENKIEYFDKSLELFTLMRKKINSHFKYLTENQRSIYWGKYEYLIPMLYEASYYNRNNLDVGSVCFDAALFSKGLLLNTSIEFAKLLEESNNNEARNIYHHALYIKDKMNSLDKNSEQLDSLLKLEFDLERKLIQLSKPIGDFTHKMNVSWKDVQYNLNQNDIAIEFIDFQKENDRIYAAIVVSKDLDKPKLISLFSQNDLDSLLKNKTSSEIYKETTGLHLTKLIWEPLFPFFNKDSKIYFSPSSMLYSIAIESLPIRNREIISDYYNIIRLSSTRELCFNKTNDKISSGVLYGGLEYKLTNKQLAEERRAYSNFDKESDWRKKNKFRKGTDWKSLPKTKIEVEYIDSLFIIKKIKSKLYTGIKGDEDSFKKLSGDDLDIIHVATHGFFLPIEKAKQLPYFDKDNSKQIIEDALDRSGLILAGANDAWTGNKITEGFEDGILTAKEISLLNFRNTNLVVLSACETGLGEITSEGVFGLQRAFKKTGVNSIMMSLWKVNDHSTEYFMSKFYDGLLNGKTKRDAFLEVQQRMRQSKEFNDPYYWAAFVLVD